jgi:imidazolonepropionase-like amidohydrolase
LRAITPETDLTKIIAKAKAAGATGIKIYADLPADLVKKLTVEAHRQGMRVWSHATIYPSKPGDALNAGVDVLSHSALLVYEGVTEVPETYHASRAAVKVGYGDTQPDSEVMTNLLRRMRAQGTILDATLFVTSQLARPGATTNNQDPRLAWTFEITKRAHQLGVPIAAGTDGMGRPGRDDLPNIHTEMELLVTKCGLSPLEAITAATGTGARVLGIEASYGTITIGKVADLILLDADPSTDIRNTRRIVGVIKGGRLYLRTETRNE